MQAFAERVPLGQMLASSGPLSLPSELAASSAPLAQLLGSVRPRGGGPSAGLQQVRPPAFGGVPGGVAPGPQQPHGPPMDQQLQQHPQQPPPQQQQRPLLQQQPVTSASRPAAPMQQQTHHPGNRPMRPQQQPMSSTGMAPPMQRPQGVAGLQQQQLPPATFRAAVPFTGQQPPGIGDDVGPGPTSQAMLPRRFAPVPGPAVFIPGLDGDPLPGLGDDEPPQAQQPTQSPRPVQPQQQMAQRPPAARPQVVLTAPQQVCHAAATLLHFHAPRQRPPMSTSNYPQSGCDAVCLLLLICYIPTQLSQSPDAQ